MSYALPALCPNCNRYARSFWEVEFGEPCADCRLSESERAQVAKLRAAVESGRVAIERLTKLGRRACGPENETQ